jgi:hypothetical protein
MTRLFSHQEIENLKENFDMKSLVYWRDAAKGRLEDMKKNVAAFLAAVETQVSIVANTKYAPYVELNRRVNYDNRVEFTVALHHVPEAEIPGLPTAADIVKSSRLHHPTFDHQRFTGAERHEAIAYANRLSKEHADAEIIKTGWGWNKKGA